MVVLGTAGHVDHGKSSLVQALTGIDPDRLREEKERGLTIDLGFAWLTLPSGREVSIVDVPGHERFIKNMLAGAGGVDLALLVVAADEGPMPQTHEHLAILDLLDVPAAVVAITKIDAAETDYTDLVVAEIEEVLRTTRFAGAPIVRTSSVSRKGLEELCVTLDAALDVAPGKRDLGRARLPIDRAFTARGFGVVVTGTLLDGSLVVGQEVELQPGGQRARVRGLQRHKTAVTRLGPGTRAAVNLSGVRLEDVQRGMVVASPGAVTAAHAVDVRLRATSIVEHPIRDGAGVTFLSATAEAEGRLRLLDRSEIQPGQEAWAQLVLDSPVAVVAGDRCVLRASDETVAGGIIVALNPKRHRRSHPPTIAALERLLAGTPEERLLDMLAAGPMGRAAIQAALKLDGDALDELLMRQSAEGRVGTIGGRVSSTEWVRITTGRLVAEVSAYLANNRLREGAPREHIRSAVGLEAAVFEALATIAIERGELDADGATLAPVGYQPALTADEEEAAARFCADLAAGGTSPAPVRVPPPDVVAFLVQKGRVVDAGAGVYFAPEAYEGMVARVRAHLQDRGVITLAETRDLLATSRKYAQALLEHLDATHVTRRTGDSRSLR